MATAFTTTTFETTYKDDFKDSDNFHRILFNSGRSLQARELTQMQTIIQEEISRFGTNIFREGGKVSGGNLTLNNREFIKLTSGALPADASTVVNELFTDGTGIIIKILKVVEEVGSDPDTIYVEYTDRLQGTAGPTVVRCANGGTLTHNGGTLDNLTIASSDATGLGLEASVSSGSFYIQGRFVFVKQQSVIVSKYTTQVTRELGFKLEQDIISTADDTALFDNQGSVPNEASPGADRWRIRLTLTTKDQLGASDNFVFLSQVNNGKTGIEVTRDNSYNIILDTIARRTKEESGNYVVQPFQASFDLLNDSNLSLDVSGGIAYVEGYRIQSKSTGITVPKARTTQANVGDTVIPVYGNFVLFDSNYSLPELHSRALLTNDSSGLGSKIGTARIRHYEEDGADFRAYLYDIKMDAGQNFASTQSIGAGATDFINPKLVNSRAELKNTLNNSLLFPLPFERPSTIAYTAANEIVLQRKYTVTTNASGILASNEAIAEGNTFTSTSQWIATRRTGQMDALTFNISLGTPTGSEFNITGGAEASTAYDIYALQTHKGTSNFSAKTKSLATGVPLTTSMQTDVDSNGSGTKFISLRKADIFKVEEIALNGAGGTDLSNFFEVDNGQRDNFYDIGRLNIKSGASLPTGNVFVRFRHFTHSTSGTHFDVTSYPTGDSVGYEGIPDFRKAGGDVINLRNVLDFRPVAGILADSAGVAQHTFDSAGSGNQIVPLLPVSGQSFDVNASYYLPRADRLVLVTADDEKKPLPRGQMEYIQGDPDLNPRLPAVPEGGLALQNFNINGYTLNESDLSSQIIESKGFTMRDIARLENRIEDLESLTALSLLENATEALTVIDSAGLSRLKSGFIADTFTDFTFSDVNRNEYRASVENTQGVLRPLVINNDIRLIYDSDNSTSSRGNKRGLEQTGEFVTLPIDSSPAFLDQSFATETENVNPFSVITGKGIVELSPASDTWVERRRAPEIVVDGGEIVNTRRVEISLGNRNALFSGAPFIDEVTTTRNVVGTRVIAVELIPFMRSRKVFFRAQGLRPRTRYFPYLGRRAIDSFAKGETSFTRFGTTNVEIGNLFFDATTHPEGTENLETDATGQLIGSFIVPNTASNKFRAGAQEFKLLDVSGAGENESNSLSSARINYNAQGVIETVQSTVRTTRIIDRTVFVEPEVGEGTAEGPSEPLAQTFFIDPFTHPNGLFITKTRIFFATKSTTVPVRCEVRPVENGIPTSFRIPGAVKFLGPSEVNIPTDLNDLDNIRSNGTDFVFEEPIYLTPGREYCIVLLAETVEYTVHVAKIYDFLIGTTGSRVSQQPTLGSFFMSQNSFTWTPDQERDLMFILYRAEFATSGNAKFGNATNLRELLPTPSFLTDSGGTEVKVLMPGHGLQKNDKVFISGTRDSDGSGILDSDVGGAFTTVDRILGSRTVTKVDHTGFAFAADSNAAATLLVGGSNSVVTRNIMYDEFYPNVAALRPSAGTTITPTVKRTSGSSYASLRNTSPVNGKDAAFGTITLNETNVLQSPSIILNDSNEAVHSISGRSFEMNLALATDDTKVSPIVDIQRAVVAATENIIDRQDASLTTNFNVPLQFVDETDRSQGSHASKHVTIPVVLEEPAVGINILFAANRPAAAGFRVYFKTGQADDNLNDFPYIELTEEGNNPADEVRSIFREYQYLAGGQVGNLDAFTQFQVKIVMTSTNSAKHPIIKDFRAIALVS